LLCDLARLHEERRDFAAAVATYNRVRQKDRYGGAGQYAACRTGILKLEQFHDTVSARGSFERCLHISPTVTWAEEALFRLAQLDHNSHRLDETIARLEEYLARFPSSSRADSATYMLATLLRQERGDFRQALDLYEQLLERFPRSGMRKEALQWAGWCLVQQGIESKARNGAFDMNAGQDLDSRLYNAPRQ
jgi:tetratricopeptide (TPR) repeat protein